MKNQDHKQEKRLTRSRDFDAKIELGPDATRGDKLRALRLSRKMTLTALAKATGLTERALRYMENNQRQPGVEAIKKVSAVLGVGTDYFMDDEIFRQELRKEEILARAKEKYGSRGMAQAQAVYETAKGLYAGGTLNEEEKDAFRDLMMEIFFETKEEARQYTPKKYR